ncbi:MAG: IS200/IS605 family element transposase accessory protein TnpB [Candidatus Methanomethyliales bacterium]|nr:IS200/IS605 family element transposase accessory protein TnpB [Candidatus Methanomethylicales archaeon]
MRARSLMKAKTIKAKVLELRKGKEELLRREYENWQNYLRGDKTAQLFSATKQQAERLLGRLKGKLKPNKEYPLILRRDVYRANTKLTPYWLKIPVYGVKGGINVPIKTHEPITDDMVCREAKMIRKDNEWFVYITVEREVDERTPKSILAIDLGIRWIATTVNSNNPKPKFYGMELRRVKGHFFWLRRTLSLKKAYKAIKKVGHKERRAVNDILHKISKAIVNEALENDSIIVLGDLKGIRRNGEGKGRRFNRKLNNGFPYYKLSQYIEYKARWLGIKVIKVNERNTSKVCHRCGFKGLRVGSLFKCPNCGYTCNADYNGAMNILKRAMGYMPIAGAALTQPTTRYDETLRVEEPRISWL